MDDWRFVMGQRVSVTDYEDGFVLVGNVVARQPNPRYGVDEYTIRDESGVEWRVDDNQNG